MKLAPLFIAWMLCCAAALAQKDAGISPAAALAVEQKLRFASVFSKGCVLQREMPLPVWGWASPGADVSVELAGRKAGAKADANGRWQVTFEPLLAGGPHVLKVNAGAESLEVADVLLGEVWVGVGQSNMIMGLTSTDGGAEAYARSKEYSLLRFAGGTAQLAETTEPTGDLPPITWGPPATGNSAVSFFFAEQLYNYFEGKVPVGILNFGVIAPAESWASVERLQQNPALVPLAKHFIFPHLSGRAFNGTVKPLAPFALRGVLYYQGEMNGGRGLQFRAIMPEVIASWRDAWNRPDLPFLFVQLAAFQEHKKAADAKLDMRAEILSKLNREEHGFPFVREAQLLTALSVPGSGMAVAIDIGDQWDIHPPNKKTVGERLFLLARSKAYGEKGVACTGPVAREATFENDQVIVTFELEAGTELTARSEPLSGFELAGADRIFHPAEARISGTKVIVKSQAVGQPVMLHYAWAGFPEPGLFDNTGLPASPFRFYDYSRVRVSQDSFEWSLGNDDILKSKEAPGWEVTGTAEVGVGPDGKPAVSLKADRDTAFRNSETSKLFFTWNADPLIPKFIRPGSLVGFSFDMAAADSQDVRLYVRPGANHQAGGAEAWGGASFAETTSADFKKVHIARVLQSARSEYHSIGLLLALVEPTPEQPSAPVFLRNLSAFRFVRPLLDVAPVSAINLGIVAKNQPVESKPIRISNSQKSSLPQNLNAEAAPEPLDTVLYGLADVPQDGGGILQTVLKPGEGIGAVIIGEGFELVGNNVAPDHKGVKLVGADGEPGLTGGNAPEEEILSVRFKGGNAPGIKSATLRIVTQAANLGCLSQGKTNEPPANLSYLDIPISVTVR